MDPLLTFLNEGGTFHYAPISGGLILMRNGERVTNVAYTMIDFLNLRSSEEIELTDTWGQGHPVFHGRVDVYKKKGACHG